MTGPETAKVLIVEDEQIVADDLRSSLIEMGYDAFATAASAEEAVAHATAACPDIVLMDIRIKGTADGIQTAAMLKRKFPVSVIYLTAHTDASMLDRAKRTDPHGYLLKPVKLSELRSMIEIVLHRRQMEQELRRAHEQTRELAQRLETAREEERRAVAVRLHDGIAQDLFAMSLDLSRLEELAKKRVGIRKICKEVALAVVKCMESTRQIANDLRPMGLAYLPVSRVIAEHARHFEQRSKLKIRITESEAFPQLSESVQLLLFRAAQEALTNVARHAHATGVEINLRAEDERITLEIADDGIGIEDGALNKPRSMGILALRERFEALGGGLSIQPARSRGTSMTVYLPRAEPPDHAG